MGKVTIREKKSQQIRGDRVYIFPKDAEFVKGRKEVQVKFKGVIYTFDAKGVMWIKS